MADDGADGIVADTNVLLDSTKPDSATDAPLAEIRAARLVVAELLEGSLKLAYSKAVAVEWTDKGLLNDDAIVRSLLDQGKLVLVKPHKLSRGQEQDLGEHVDHDDQPFVLVAAVVKSRILLTRDPKTTKPKSRKQVKRLLGVLVRLASEYDLPPPA